VVDLIARSAGADLLPLTIGGVALAEVALGQVTSVAPFRGQAAAVSAALQAAFGFGFPRPNQTGIGGAARIVWAGMDRALLIGAAVPAGLTSIAALVDQTDAAVTVQVAGPGATAVLARLIPLDLRPAAMPVGQTARSQVNHMAASITRTGPDVFEVMVFRSMAGTLIDELTHAAQGVAARG